MKKSILSRGEKKKILIVMGIILGIVILNLVYSFSFNNGYTTCKKNLQDWESRISLRESNLKSLQKALEENASKISQEAENLNNLTKELGLCQDKLGEEGEYKIFFLNLQYSKQELIFLFHSILLIIPLSFFFPITINLIKVKVKFSEAFETTLIILILFFIFLFFLYGIN